MLLTLPAQPVEQKGVSMIKKLAFASIMTALTVVSLYGSVVFPMGRIALLALTSLCVLVTHAECGTKYSLIQFLAAGLIGFLLIPFKFQMVLFIAFLGYYPIVKSYIEQLHNHFLEWLVKILFFNAILIVAYFVLNYALLAYINFGIIFEYVLSHLFIVIIVSEIVFILYDYMLSMLASYYMNVVQKRMRK